MDSRKYIGMDVHQAAVSLAVLDASGRLVIESVIEAKAAVILEFFGWLRGNLWVTFEEGTWAAWLYDLLKPHVAQVVVCNPRKNALLKEGNKSDRVDARKLAELLRAGLLSPVYHGESGVRTLRELARSYLTITKDLTRVMNRIKGLYRSWAIACSGQTVYAPRHRAAWLEKLPEAGIRRRAGRLYQQLDQLRLLHQEARRELVSESQKHAASQLLRQIPGLGPIRAALLIALLQTPQRFRTKRQLWAYSGLALRTRSSADYRFAAGQLQRSKKLPALRGLNENHNHELKNLFKSTATQAVAGRGPFHDFYAALLTTGMNPAMALSSMAARFRRPLPHASFPARLISQRKTGPRSTRVAKTGQPRWSTGFSCRRAGSILEIRGGSLFASAEASDHSSLQCATLISGHLREEPYAGKPHGWICEGEAE